VPASDGEAVRMRRVWAVDSKPVSSERERLIRSRNKTHENKNQVR
jgi:hypothetical protein